MINFNVNGQPVPQGSMKVINGHVIHSQGSALAAWRSAIALSAKLAGAKPHLEPVFIKENVSHASIMDNSYNNP